MGRGGGRHQLAAGGGEAGLHLGKFKPQQGGAGGQHEVEAGRHEVLVLAVDFAEAALGPVAVDGVTHGGAGGDDPDAGRAVGGTDPPCKEEGSAVNAAALLPDSAEISIAPQVLAGAQAHFRRP